MRSLNSSNPLLPILILGPMLIWSPNSFSQPVVVGPDQSVDDQTRSGVIQQLTNQLNAQYVFPAVAAQILHILQTQLAACNYDRIT